MNYFVKSRAQVREKERISWNSGAHDSKRAVVFILQ